MAEARCGFMNSGQHAKEITRKTHVTAYNAICLNFENTKELRATTSEIAAPKPDLNANAKNDDFGAFAAGATEGPCKIRLQQLLTVTSRCLE